jgi:hypothetical protein
MRLSNRLALANYINNGSKFLRLYEAWYWTIDKVTSPYYKVRYVIREIKRRSAWMMFNWKYPINGDRDNHLRHLVFGLGRLRDGSSRG